jgi:hypothetical protein
LSRSAFFEFTRTNVKGIAVEFQELLLGLLRTFDVVVPGGVDDAIGTYHGGEVSIGAVGLRAAVELRASGRFSRDPEGDSFFVLGSSFAAGVMSWKYLTPSWAFAWIEARPSVRRISWVIFMMVGSVECDCPGDLLLFVHLGGDPLELGSA